MILRRASFLLLLCNVASLASVVGTSQPAQPLTEGRIQQLIPADQRAPWVQYLQRSEEAMRVDKAALQAERHGLVSLPGNPKEGRGAASMPLNRDAAWYSSSAARHIADVIVSFQTPAGGWGKNMDMSAEARLRGQIYVVDNNSKLPSSNDFDAPADTSWHYVGTIDNDATVTEILFLGRVQNAANPTSGAAYRESILRGIRYLLNAQYPNGGWPQVWPLEGGYHDAITFNDDAITNVLRLLTRVANGDTDFRFIQREVRVQAEQTVASGIKCILSSQIIVMGQRAIWAQQYDMLTLVPVAARNYEPVAFSSGESAHLLDYLMDIPNQIPELQKSIRAGVIWLEGHAIYGKAVIGGRDSPEGRHLVSIQGAGPIWSRFYSISTGEPIFGDRDKSIHDDMNEISAERRNGYAWYGNAPATTIERFKNGK